jgi:subtilisin family serine protease
MRSRKLKTVYLFVTLIFLGIAFGVTAAGPGPGLDHEPTLSPDSEVRSERDLAAGEAVYIVQLVDEPLATYDGGTNALAATDPSRLGLSKLDLNSEASATYLDYLAAVQTDFLLEAGESLKREIEPIYHYDVVFNGLAMLLTPEEALAIANLPGVLNVQRDTWHQKQTDVTPAFIGAQNIWDGSASGSVGTKGEGIIVGVIDTGIWPEHPSFADDGSYPAPTGWNGGCSLPSDGSQPYACNNKLIGAKHFLMGYNTAVGKYDGLFNSARDDDGHGTHTASTAAGNEGVEVTLLDVDRGLISGIAPRAYVAAYKGLGPQGGLTSDLVAAINAAVADGVDVINYSIGGGASNPWAEASSFAFRAARNAGVFVATSAGNSGPDPSTLGSPGNAPWLTTVGASTSNRHFISDISLSGPETPPTGLFGTSITEGVSNFNLVDAEGIADAEGDMSGLCLNPFPAGTFNANDVVLCQRGQIARVLRGTYVQAGGGGGVILYNPVEQGLDTDNYVIPAAHVDNVVGQLIKDYLTEHPGEVTVSFSAGQKIFDTDPRVNSNMMAAFSARGPNTTVMDVIKPDVTAPGVQILAGASPQHVGPGAQGELFQAIPGTSMSSPHVAGAAALVAAVNPDWTPAETESALMTTANTDHVKEDGVTIAGPFDMGAGRIDLNKAARAPLVLNETNENYIAANPNAGGDPKTLNNASLGNANCVNFCVWTRTLRNVTGETMSWDASLSELSGTVTPPAFTLEPGEEITLSIVVSAAGLTPDEWAYGLVEIIPQNDPQALNETVSTHMPIAIIPDLVYQSFFPVSLVEKDAE